MNQSIMTITKLGMKSTLIAGLGIGLLAISASDASAFSHNGPAYALSKPINDVPALSCSLENYGAVNNLCDHTVTYEFPLIDTYTGEVSPQVTVYSNADNNEVGCGVGSRDFNGNYGFSGFTMIPPNGGDTTQQISGEIFGGGTGYVACRVPHGDGFVQVYW